MVPSAVGKTLNEMFPVDLNFVYVDCIIDVGEEFKIEVFSAINAVQIFSILSLGWVNILAERKHTSVIFGLSTRLGECRSTFNMIIE